MKVEQSFVIDGQVVTKQHEGRDTTIFATKDLETLFIISNDSGEVLTRIDIRCEMRQGMGFVDSLNYSEY